MSTAKISLTLDEITQLHNDLTTGDPNAVLDFAHASGNSAISNIATEAVKDAAAGAAGVEVAAAAITMIAAELGVSAEVAAFVVSAAAEVGITIGAGASLGSTLGPIGAAVGAIIGVIIAIVTIGAAKGANGFSSPNPWTDPDGVTQPGTLLSGEAQAYLASHPSNPLLQLQLAVDSKLKDSLGLALGPNFNWSEYGKCMGSLFIFAGNKTGFHAGAVYQAFVAFFKTLHAKGVKLADVSKLIAAYCDFNARVRAAEVAWEGGLPAGFTIDPNSKAGSSNALTWHVHDMLAAQAFDGVTPHLDVTPGADSFGWGESFGVRRDGEPWSSITASPYYQDISKALNTMAKAVYAKPAFTGTFRPLNLAPSKPKLTNVAGLVAHNLKSQRVAAQSGGCLLIVLLIIPVIAGLFFALQ